MLTTEDLKKDVPLEVWQKITQGDDTLGERFLNKARAWMLARLRPCQITSFDETDDIVAMILINRALYEMYAFVEKEDLAFDKKETAEELLVAIYGSCVQSGTGAETQTGKGIPVGTYVAGSDNWERFK